MFIFDHPSFSLKSEQARDKRNAGRDPRRGSVYHCSGETPEPEEKTLVFFRKKYVLGFSCSRVFRDFGSILGYFLKILGFFRKNICSGVILFWGFQNLNDTLQKTVLGSTNVSQKLRSATFWSVSPIDRSDWAVSGRDRALDPPNFVSKASKQLTRDACKLRSMLDDALPSEFRSHA